jgi:hypothetical protein
MPDSTNKSSPSDLDESNLFAFDTSKLGSPKLVDGRLEWIPPEGMRPAEAQLVQEALRHFNEALKRGEHKVEVTSAGKIAVE